MKLCVFGSKMLPSRVAIFLLLILPGVSSAQQQVEIKPAENVSNIQTLSPFSQQIKSFLSTLLISVKGKADAERYEGIAAYYQQNEFAPIWLLENKPLKKAIDAAEVLLQAAEHGLNPNDYTAEILVRELRNYQTANLAELEIRLSTAITAYSQHLNAGRLDPQAVNREIVVFPKAVSPAKILEEINKTKFVSVYLRLLAPHTPRYERLRVALANFKTIKSTGGWTNIPPGEVLKPGMHDPRILALHKRMVEDGRLKNDRLSGEEYDETLATAVKHFQLSHGLEPDGVIGPQTLAQLNVSVEERIRTIIINLERRRWMQNDYGDYYVFANLADQVIKLVKNEKTLHAELIQVGQPYHRTPVFSDIMEYVEINPFWNVPYSIATKEYLPKLKSSPGILNRQKIRVIAKGKIISPFSVPWNNYSRRHFPVRLRQDSGPKNALGRIKFMFPNKFNVYIHDTPSKAKFAKASRYFSHGCLRLKDPLTMAEHILGPLGWKRARIDKVVKSGKRTIVKLDKKIPVHVTYLTAWVNKDGSVHFRRDIYGRDKKLDAALKKASTL